ncbi:MAG: MSHA biogenesis protein MshD [Proteobacteria bacterium]|nr:MAG: MSHA biogenesis protein MshD [Pseudomonadota bacterium]
MLTRFKGHIYGTTFIELIITMVIISIALVSVTSLFSATVGRSADPLWQVKTLKLAQFYMDEILSKRYDETTPVGGVPASTAVHCGSLGPEEANREDFDDVDDYITSGITPTIVNSGSINMDTSYTHYRIAIDVACRGGDLGLSPENAKKITLTITPPGSMSVSTFTTYKGNF